MKLALVHDHLIQAGGAEKVLQVFQEIWPNAPTYTLLYDEKKMSSEFGGRDIRTSFLSHWPLANKKFQWYLPLMPAATEHHDLNDFDLILSSSSAFSKGVIGRPGSLHICYCHTPTRYLWSDTNQYLENLKIPKIIKHFLPAVLSQLRLWDRSAADRVNLFIANSEAVRRRIKQYYGRDSEVIYPPVDTSRFVISQKPKKYFLTGGRLVAYKRFDLAVDALTKTGLPLKIFGTGPEETALRRRAGTNVQFLGRVSDEIKADLYANCLAFLHPHEEDFGLTQVEAMASGRPVIAWRRGGAIEAIEEGVTGEFIDEQSWEELADHVIRFDGNRYDPERIRQHTQRFDSEIFKTKMRQFIETKWQEHALNH